MFRHYIKNTVRFSVFLPFNLFGADNVDKSTNTAQKVELDSTTEVETGWDRVKRLFEVDEFGNISEECNSVLQVGAMSMFVGAIYGGVVNSRATYSDFMANNQATSFKNHLEAKQKLQTQVTTSFSKGAFKWSWRLALFTSTFLGISTIISTYRDKTSIIEFVGAGAISGGLYKFNGGPRAWVVGAGLGSVLGLVCGGASLGLLALSGMSMKEARYWQQYWKHERSEYLRKGVAEHLAKEDLAVIKLHDDQVGESGKDIANLDKQSAA